MKTIIKYNITPNDGQYDTATSSVEKIVRDFGRKKITVDELIIEVGEVFTVKIPNVNKSFNGSNSTNIVKF